MEDKIDRLQHRRSQTAPATSRSIGPGHLVVTAFGPQSPPLPDLERERVGKRPSRVPAADRVAVQVEQRVQVGQRLPSVRQEDGQARRPEAASVQVDRILDGRR